METKIKHYYLLFYLLFKKKLLIYSSIISISILYSCIYNNYLFIYIILIILIHILYNLNKNKYVNLIGLSIFPNNILIYNSKIKFPIEYDFILNHEIKHLYQFKNKKSKFENLDFLENEADSYSLKKLSKIYTKIEIKEHILNNKLFFK